MDHFVDLTDIKRILKRFKLYLCVLFLLFLIYLYYAGYPLIIYYKRKLPDIQGDVENISSRGRNIFFVETSSTTEDYVMRLTSRQACAVESAAKRNPETTIYVLFTLPLGYPDMDRCTTSNCNTIRELLKYKNIKIRSVNMYAYFKDTPLENWLKRGELLKSESLVEHTSDVMRYLTLWKFGGTYMDLDVVVLKSFEDLAPNFAGSQFGTNINSGVINFDRMNFGHELAELCVREIRDDFQGDVWDYNGPDVITRVMMKICNTDRIDQMTPETCHGFHVLPENVLYPISYSNWKWYFISDYTDYVVEKVNQSYAVHIWNKLSSDEKIPKEKDVAYTRLAKTNCPNVFKQVDVEF